MMRTNQLKSQLAKVDVAKELLSEIENIEQQENQEQVRVKNAEE
jgi:hypothetical protein